MGIDLDQFHEVFFAESLEALDSMESALLKLAPGTADAETINTVFRVAHSIKGGAGMFGFNELAGFTHTLETLLDALRGGRMAVTASLADGLLRSVDQMRGMLSAIQKQQSFDPAGAQALRAEFSRLLGEPAKPVADAARAGAAPSGTAAIPSAGGPRRRWRIGFKALPGLLARGNDPLRMFAELQTLGELSVRADCGAVPELAALEPGDCGIAWKLELATAADRSAIESVFEWAEGDCELTIEAEIQSVAQPAVQSAAEVNSIRVATEKIDGLLNTVGEIVITQSMLSQLSRRFEGAEADRLRSGLAQLEMNIRELQECVMRVRMLPVGSVFSRFPRLVRDLSTRLGKRIRLQISGEQTELDKTVLERIGDPLVHLVRNSIDHGIESPAARLAAGKPEEGTIHLNAFHKGGSIGIVISDDGGGLDRRRILDKARAQGLVDPAAVLSDEQVDELIFLPGFSTAARTTDLSGRGVGMDVVLRNIKDLGGHVQLQSTPGQGTRITITLPLTLAIVDGQSVSVGPETYIVPLVAVVESLQLRPGAASRIHEHGEVFPFRNEYLPVIRLHELFGVSPRSTALHEGLIMVIEADGRRAGLFIDELLGQQQVVIKSMEANYAPVEGVGGATILGEGTVALILDVPGLLRMMPPVRQLRPAG